VSRYDLAVLGGGTAGLVAAAGAAGVGARVCLVEPEATGGECLWTGCVPSKSLLAGAELAHRMRHADQVGLAPVEPAVDFDRVMGHVRQARAQLAAHDSPERLRAEGVEVIEGSGRFIGSGRIAVGGRTLTYRTALVATGSALSLPAIPGLAAADPLTHETVWELASLPERLVVLGAGPVGCELAQAFARLGSQVTLVEALPSVLGAEEPEARTAVADQLAADGVELRVSARADRVEPVEGGHRLVLGDEHADVEFDRILVATGKRAATEGLGLEAVGVATDGDGSVTVDERLATTARGVFAAGDVTGTLPFTHVAGYQAGLVVTNALFGLRRRASYEAIPWVTFTEPEVGRVGLTETQARARFEAEPVVATYDYAGLDRAVCAGRAAGTAKLVADPKGRLVGATVAAPAAGEAIAELAAAVASQAKLDDLGQRVRAYPTFAEGPGRAAGEHLRSKWLGPRVRRVTKPALGALRLAGAAERGVRAGRPGRDRQGRDRRGRDRRGRDRRA
jgi:pyruvate/2-oxoglutarate dehydrogenase complex dihydrolipoamide dehydrogenase (E3) component